MFTVNVKDILLGVSHTNQERNTTESFIGISSIDYVSTILIDLGYAPDSGRTICIDNRTYQFLLNFLCSKTIGIPSNKRVSLSEVTPGIVNVIFY